MNARYILYVKEKASAAQIRWYNRKQLTLMYNDMCKIAKDGLLLRVVDVEDNLHLLVEIIGNTITVMSEKTPPTLKKLLRQ